jgi:hypothetical protein
MSYKFVFRNLAASYVKPSDLSAYTVRQLVSFERIEERESLEIGIGVVCASWCNSSGRGRVVKEKGWRNFIETRHNSNHGD